MQSLIWLGVDFVQYGWKSVFRQTAPSMVQLQYSVSGKGPDGVDSEPRYKLSDAGTLEKNRVTFQHNIKENTLNNSNLYDDKLYVI